MRLAPPILSQRRIGAATATLAMCLAVALAESACGGARADTLTMATTTSVGNSGLLDVLLPAYEEAVGSTVQAHLVGSGRALALLADGSVDLVISHAPDAEAAALSAHRRWTYRKLMFNDFVIVGPPDDPAEVVGAATAAEAMRRIALSAARFISRGDESGTHERERQLWAAAGAAPPGDRLAVAGSGMGSTLRVTSETSGYTLTDRATYAQHAGTLRLRVVFEGDPDLLNTYALVVDPAAPRGREAQAFAEWLATGAGREVIETYRVAGNAAAFHPWPAGRPSAHPRDLPR